MKIFIDNRHQVMAIAHMDLPGINVVAKIFKQVPYALNYLRS